VPSSARSWRSHFGLGSPSGTLIEQDAPRSWRVPDPLLRNFLLELDSGGI